MKKVYLTLSATLLALTGASAQKGALVLQSPNVPVEYQVIKLSPNGQWACGNINDGFEHSFRWNLVTGEFRELSPQGAKSNALSVSNDGTVAGTFMDDEYLSYGGTIEAAGYWRDGRWHHLNSNGMSAPTDDTAGSQAQCISPNGRYIGGIAMINGMWSPVRWDLTDGLMKVLAFDNLEGKSSAGSIFDVADNGLASGWIYRTSKSNRTPCIWTAEGDTILPAFDRVGPFCSAGSISPDGNKVLAYDRIYDVKTNTSKRIIDFGSDVYAFVLNSIDNDGGAIGYVQASAETSAEAAVLSGEGKITLLSDLFKSRGLDLTKKYPALLQGVGMTSDHNNYAFVAYDSASVPRSVVVRFDQNVTTAAPVRLTAKALEGAGAVELTWQAPLAGAAGVKGYNLYRGSEKLTATPVTTLRYIDSGLADGSYSYTVKAVYAGGEGEASAPAEATLAPATLGAPRSLTASQRGYNNVRLMWEAPDVALPAYTYADSTGTIYSMGGGATDMETGILIPADVLAAYAAKGQQLTDVSFYPMTAQKEWKVNLYTVTPTDTTLAYTQTIPGTQLTAGERNNVALTTPFTLPAGKGLIVGVEVTMASENYSVFGIQHGVAIPGYTDLIRQAHSGESFYSMQERVNSGDAPVMYEYTWPITANFATADSRDKAAVKGYKLYVNGKLQAEPAATADNYLLPAQADGSYQYALTAVNAAGVEGTKAEATAKVKADADVLKPQDVKVSVVGPVAKATWQAPADDSRSQISYADETSAGGTKGDFMAKTIYDGSIIRPYDGYQIKALRFFPLAEADFTIYLEQDGKTVATLYPSDYTLGEWNELRLDKPVALSRNSSYAMIVDCYDVESDAAALGMDGRLAVRGTSDLYSQNEGKTYASLSSAGGRNGNWMMGLVVGTPEAADLGVKGYRVTIDNAPAHEGLLTETSLTKNFNTDATQRHSLRVAAVYGEGDDATEAKAATVYFLINPTTGITDATTAAIDVTKGTTHLNVGGVDVKDLNLYSADGKLAVSAKGNILSIQGLPAGIYVLRITAADGKVYSQKLAI